MIAKLWAIVRREYVERVRTKAFVIGTILGPLLMGGMMIGPALAARAKGKPLRVAVLDDSGVLREAVEQALRDVEVDGRPRFDVQASVGVAGAPTDAELEQAVREKRLDGYLTLPADAVEAGAASYHGRNVSNRTDIGAVEDAVNGVLIGRRLTAAGLEQARVEDLTRELDMKTFQVLSQGVREDRGAATVLALVQLMILYVGILLWGQAVLTSVIEEKTSRVVEVMAAGVPPTTLLLGKLIGVGSAGLTQFLVWSLSLFSVSLASASMTTFSLPEVTPLMLVSFVAFFLLGYFFYAALYAAIGACVNTTQEAQSLVFPVMLPIIMAMVCFPAVLEAPEGPLAFTTSMIPGMSPLVMFLRIVVLTPPLWQILLSIALLLLGILAVVWIAARVYRVGILMYGKRPTFPELVRWVRHG